MINNLSSSIFSSFFIFTPYYINMLRNKLFITVKYTTKYIERIKRLISKRKKDKINNLKIKLIGINILTISTLNLKF